MKQEHGRESENFSIIITDGVIDDLLALKLLQRLASERQQIVSTFGNIPQSQAHKNLSDFLSVTDFDWNLTAGSDKPLSGKFEYTWLDYFNGSDGLWGMRPTIPDSTSARSNQTQDISRRVISLGALTGLQKIQEAHRKNLQTITIMGGVFYEKGNYTQYSECNIAYDPDAAHGFFQNCNGIDVKVVPLDVTRRVCWEHETFDTIPEATEYNRWFKHVLRAWYKNYGFAKKSVLNLHDPLAVYLTFFPEAAEWKQMGVNVVLDGEERGRTVEDSQNPSCYIAVTVKDPQQVAKDIFHYIFD